jgi:hypothetical protein
MQDNIYIGTQIIREDHAQYLFIIYQNEIKL